MASPSYSKNSPRAPGIAQTFQAGLAHYQAGRLDRAETLLRKALQRAPDHADTLHLLGVIAEARGRHEYAGQLIRRALKAVPDSAEVSVSLGNALRSVGRLEEAAESYRRAIALKPGLAVAHCNLACVLNEQRAFEDARGCASRAVALMPGLAEAQIALAVALVGLRRFSEAEGPYRRALALQPDRATTHSDLGVVLTELERFDEAVQCHERAIELVPNAAGWHYELGATLFRAADLHASETSYRRALACAPEAALAWNGLGTVLRALGRFGEAISCYRRALELDPGLTEAEHSLAVTGQQSYDGAEAERLRASLADPELATGDQIAAGFALGTLLDNAERFDEAFAYFAEANALHRQQLGAIGARFDFAALRREVDGLIERCTPALFSLATDWGNRSELPVFIVGMPRSGTTLVEQIAASHSRVFGAGERKNIGQISAALLAHNNDRPAERWDAQFARELAEEHIAFLQELGGGAARVTDKLPDNVFLLGVIAALFPAARVILCRRDPRDIGLSCYFHLFAEPMPFAYDLADCGRRLLEVERLTEHWRSVLPLRVLTIDYEALVANLERVSRRLIEFLGLDWEPACLEFYRTQRPVLTASSWQVRQPLFHRSVGRWRRYERHLEPLLEVLAHDGATAAAKGAGGVNMAD
jgi:tetratricopeptide (TPR) repeat protein